MSGILGGIAGNLAGGNIGRAVVSLVLDTTGYNSQLEKVKVETAASTEQAGAATSKFGAISTAVYATAGVAALEFAKSSVESAIEHQNVLAALTAQVGDNTQAFQDQATALQNVSGFQDEAILSADTILSRYKLTQQQVQATIPSILDLARVQGITVPDAATQFGKAVLGNTRALKALGISSEQFVVTGNRAADAAKLVALLNQQIGGQAAAYAETFAGKMEILNARFDDFKESVGGELLGQLTLLADDLNTLAAIGDKVGGSFGGLTGKLAAFGTVLKPISLLNEITSRAFQDVAGWLGITSDNTEGLTQATEAATPSLKAYGDGVQTAAEQQARLAHETKAATQAMQDQRLKALQAAGGLLGLVSSLQQTNEDQRTLNKLQQEGKTHTQAYRDAVVQATTDQLAFRTAVRQFVQDNPNRSLSQTRQILLEMGAQAGITGQQFRNALGGPLKEIIGSLDNLQSKHVRIQVDSSSLDAAEAKAQNLQRTLQRFA